MLHLTKIKYNINQHTIDKLLYFLVDRPDEITKNRSCIWKNNKDQFHRDYDLPAVIYNDGDVMWFKNNLLHRDNNKPARYWCGEIQYWVNGNKIIDGWEKI